MITQQAARRRTGRALRRARRARRARHNAPPAAWPNILQDVVTRIAGIFRDALFSLEVALRRLTPLLLTPRDGAGARRQLLDNGRGPRKGRR